MSKYEEIRRRADEFQGSEVERNVWALGEDPRFPAVVALIADIRQERLSVGSSVTAANDHGALAHCMGAIDALDELDRRLAAMVEPKAAEEAQTGGEAQ